MENRDKKEYIEEVLKEVSRVSSEVIDMGKDSELGISHPLELIAYVLQVYAMKEAALSSTITKGVPDKKEPAPQAKVEVVDQRPVAKVLDYPKKKTSNTFH